MNLCSLANASKKTTKDGSSKITQCNGECCILEQTQPYQPNLNYSKITRKSQGCQYRSFRPEWYKTFNWLSFCLSQKKAFCFYCRFICRRDLKFSEDCEDTFTRKGFDNWKKATEKCGKHEKSQTHREAFFKFQALQQPSISAQINMQHADEQVKRREALLKQLSSLKYLVRQGTSIRGHTDDEGNLIELLKCRSEDVPVLTDWLKHSSYKSHDIINELIQLMAHEVLRTLLHDVREAQWFSLIADETRDISGSEQLSVSLRWVDDNYTIHEDLVGLMEVEMTDAETLTSTLKDVLLRCNLQLSQCRGQAYDGASNMAGHISGVSTRITREEPRALYVHCLAHSLNLCLQDCARYCDCVKNALSLASDLARLIRASPKRLALFKNLKAEMNLQTTGIKPPCPTRWTVRTGALDAIIKNYEVIYTELDIVGKDSNDESSNKSSGLKALMEKFSTFFGLKLSFMVFSAMEELSKTLQSSDLNAQEASSAAASALKFLKRQRSDDQFITFYHSVVSEAKDHTDPPTLPKQKRMPKRFDDGSVNHHFSTPEDYYRKQYFEVLDLLAAEIERRFDQNSLKIINEMEQVLLNPCNGVTVQFSEEFLEKYSTDVNVERLKIQLPMLQDLIKTANEQYQFGIKRVTSINTLCDVMNTCKFSKNMFSEVHRLLRVYLTIPMSSATAERTFSALRILKNYSRSSMTQEAKPHHVTAHLPRKGRSP